jgi:hypothetical protein
VVAISNLVLYLQAWLQKPALVEPHFGVHWQPIANIRLGLKWANVTDTLAYCTLVLITAVKSFTVEVLGVGRGCHKRFGSKENKWINTKNEMNLRIVKFFFFKFENCFWSVFFNSLLAQVLTAYLTCFVNRCDDIWVTQHLCDQTFALPESPYFEDSKMECTISVAWKLTKFLMKMLNLKNFEMWICREVRRCDPPKGWWGTWVGRLAPLSPTVWSLFRTPMSERRSRTKI